MSADANPGYCIPLGWLHHFYSSSHSSCCCFLLCFCIAMAKSPDARTGNRNDDSGMCGRLDVLLSIPTNDRVMMMEKGKKNFRLWLAWPSFSNSSGWRSVTPCYFFTHRSASCDHFWKTCCFVHTGGLLQAPFEFPPESAAKACYVYDCWCGFLFPLGCVWVMPAVLFRPGTAATQVCSVSICSLKKLALADLLSAAPTTSVTRGRL